jgi:hypothetical protein
MASYHFSHAIVSRKKGQSVVASAAYRSGTELEDTRAGKTFDYTRRSGVLHAEIITPDNTPDWMSDREQLWNAVEAAEKRKDAQLARHIEVALPHELTPEQRLELVREFVRDEFVSKGMIADIAMHAPDREGDQRNYHAHILLTMRVLTGDGFGNKCREWNPDFTRAQEEGRAKTGFVVQTSQLEQWRSTWADYTNRALEREGIEARVDHRSLAEQGIEREAEFHLGWAASEMERRGEATDRGDELRDIHARNEERARIAHELQLAEAQLAAEWDHALDAAGIAVAEREEQAEKAAARAEDGKAVLFIGDQTVARDLARHQKQAARAYTQTETQILDADRISLSGAEFIAQLDKAGLSLAIVTAEDMQRLAAERAVEFAAYDPSINTPARLIPEVREGELVAVNRFGGIHRLNEHKIDTGVLASRAADGAPLRSLTEIRAEKHAEQAELAAKRQAKRDERAAAWAEIRERRKADQTNHEIAEHINTGGEAALHTIGATTTAGLMVADKMTGAVTSLVSHATDLLTAWIAPPPRKISVAEMAISADARRERYQQQQAERDRAAALDRIRIDVLDGRHLDVASVSKLTHADLVNIRDRGDDGVRAMIEAHEFEQKQKRARDYGGRTRE